MRTEMMNVDPAALAGQMTASAGLLVHATAAAVAGEADPAGVGVDRQEQVAAVRSAKVV